MTYTQIFECNTLVQINATGADNEAVVVYDAYIISDNIDMIKKTG